MAPSAFVVAQNTKTKKLLITDEEVEWEVASIGGVKMREQIGAFPVARKAQRLVALHRIPGMEYVQSHL